MNKILSVSVASYNVEQFIKQNMDSFLGTSVSFKIEVLIVDDGSKDNTGAIAKEYMEKYPETIKYVYQDNAGPGATVNTGLKNATGKYFRMVDGDDWVRTENLESYIKFLEENDVDAVYTDYARVDNDTMQEVHMIIDYPDKNIVKKYDEVCDQIPNVMMHNVTYKTSILKENDIKLDNCFYTDMEYLLLPVRYLETIAVLDLEIYMYRVSMSTQSVNINSMVKNKHMHEMVFKHLMEYFAKAKKEKALSVAKENLITKRLNIMSGNHLSTILAQKPSGKTKAELKEFAAYIKGMDKKIYDMFMAFPTMKLMRYTGYLAFKPFSNYHRKRTGAN